MISLLNVKFLSHLFPQIIQQQHQLLGTLAGQVPQNPQPFLQLQAALLQQQQQLIGLLGRNSQQIMPINPQPPIANNPLGDIFSQPMNQPKPEPPKAKELFSDLILSTNTNSSSLPNGGSTIPASNFQSSNFPQPFAQQQQQLHQQPFQ